MEATAGVSTGAVSARNGVSLPMSSPRKKWRVVSEHHSNTGDQELEGSKLGRTDERTIYEQGQEPVDVDFCSITINDGLNNDMLQQQLHNVSRQRDELQELEVELKAQLIARTEIMKIQEDYDSQIKEYANTTVKLQEKLHEREHTIHQLERKMEEKDRELHAVKLDNEVAWAKENRLREQHKELATFRRELDNSEIERSQHLQQMHDLQEHIQDKERQFLELQEQNRVAQESIIYKDGQLREAQAWISRVQEMDVLNSTTNHSLQAELRECADQYNQLWHGCQRQFAEMERLHLHTIQQLQLELADAREKSGAITDDGHGPQTNEKDASHFEQNNGSQVIRGNDTSIGNFGVLPNGSSDNTQSLVSSGHTSIQTDHVPSVPISQPSLIGMAPTYFPPEQVANLLPYVMHHQPGISPLQYWQNQQNQLQPSQEDQNITKSVADYNNETSANGQVIQNDPVIPSTSQESQVLRTLEKGYMVDPQSQQSLQQMSSQFHDALRLDQIENTIENKEKYVETFSKHGIEGQALNVEQQNPLPNTPPLETSIIFSETGTNNAVVSEAYVPAGQPNSLMAEKVTETNLLDERSLLSCIVRTIPPGGKIRISSTLPNRLGKMLAPLHWHDYKKKYGKLDEFVFRHPELFVIEGDYIQLREGAKEKIAATAAVAKVAAAAAASSPYASFLPSVAVTPMAQSFRLKRNPSSIDETINSSSQHINGGLSNVKILSKPKESLELNGAETRPGSIGSNQNRGSANSRSNTDFGGKQQARTSGSVPTTRR